MNRSDLNPAQSTQGASSLQVSPSQSLLDLPIRYALWLERLNLPFLVSSIGMIVMLYWAGAYKMTVPGANGIVPLVVNSPLISWQFKLFGTYHGADLIGATEWTAATLLLLGYKWPRIGILGGVLTTVMFVTTSSFLLTTPGTTIAVHGLRFMNDLGLFLYKDLISLGVSCYLIVRYGKTALAVRAAAVHNSQKDSGALIARR